MGLKICEDLWAAGPDTRSHGYMSARIQPPSTAMLCPVI
jgi:hypothetical protein